MSQLNFAAASEPENQHRHRNVKQFIASETSRSTMKKTALADVKNILAQKTAQSAKKLVNSASKSNVSKKNLFGVFIDKENEILKKEIKQEVELSQMKETNKSSHSVLLKEDDSDTDVGFVEHVCSFCDKIEDDYADFMFKSIRLTKNEIETLAMEWERPPAVSEKDKRTIEIPDEIPYENVSIGDWPDMFDDASELDVSLLNDIPAVESLVEFEE